MASIAIASAMYAPTPTVDALGERYARATGANGQRTSRGITIETHMEKEREK